LAGGGAFQSFLILGEVVQKGRVDLEEIVEAGVLDHGLLLVLVDLSDEQGAGLHDGRRRDRVLGPHRDLGLGLVQPEFGGHLGRR